MSDSPQSGKSQVARIDGAHPTMAGDHVPPPSDSEDLVRAASGVVPHDVADQLFTQASQLARHLGDRQREIDHREAHLNAQIAQIERELRGSRVALRDRQLEFEERERELQSKVEQLEERLSAFSAAEASAESRQATIAQREKEMSFQSATLRSAQEKLNHQSQQQTRRETEFVERERQLLTNLERYRRTLDLRDRSELDKALEQLDGQADKLAEDRRVFEARCDSGRRQLEEERHAWNARRQRLEEEMQTSRQALVARGEALDQRETSLEEMKSEALRLHRETLEMRLLAEQLWQRASEKTPTTEMTQIIGKLQADLADAYKVARRDLSDKKSDLGKLAVKLEHGQQHLAKQREELQEWVARRQADVEEQAARLVARELELDRQEREVREQQQAWHTERHDLQNEIRRLIRQNRQMTPVAA